MKNRASLLALAIITMLCGASALIVIPVHAAGQSSTDATLKDYEETVKKGDAYAEAGNYFEAVLSYERARRVAYNNKLKTDSAALEKKLAHARDVRDGKAAASQPGSEKAGAKSGAPSVSAPGSSAAPGPSYFVLTTKLADGPRLVTSHTVPQGDAHHFGPEDSTSRWNVTNPYLPVDRNFFSVIWKMAPGADGSLYLAADSIVPAAEMKLQPRSNKDYYADNGRGVWRVAPDGQVTAFAVRPYGTQPGWKNLTGVCNVRVEDAWISIDHWGGMVVDPAGDVIFSDSELHMILKLRKDGFVEQVAGGGPQACKYDRWKTLQQSGSQDGPAKQALFASPQSLAYDKEGNLLVADLESCALRRIDAAGNVTTVHKGCRFDPNIHGDHSNDILYAFLTVDPEGLPVVGATSTVQGMNLFTGLYRFHPDGKVEKLLDARKLISKAGQQKVGWMTDFHYIGDTLVIAERGDDLNPLRALHAGKLAKFMGVPNQPDSENGDIDGPAATAHIYQPGAFCTTADGTLFILPYHNRRAVRKVDPKTKIVSTWVY
jgi:hypothetical protein